VLFSFGSKSTKMSKDTIKSLKKENDELRVEIESMKNDFKKLVQDVKSSDARSTANADQSKVWNI
jgi:phosphate uptake regulator